MGRKKASEETGRVPANQNFHLSEAFFGTMETEQSMNILAPALLSAKDAKEIEEVYRQIGISDWAFGADASLLNSAIKFFYKKKIRIR